MERDLIKRCVKRAVEKYNKKLIIALILSYVLTGCTWLFILIKNTYN